MFKPGTNLPSRRTTTDDDALLNHTIVTAFAAVLGKRDVNEIIKHLSAEAAYETNLKPFFITEARQLAPFERVEDAISKKSLARSGKHNFNVLAPQNPHETGSFGAMYRSEDGRRIYKSITITVPEHIRTIARKAEFFEEKLRNIFIETFIQTILVCDPDVGSNICRPLQLFRDPKTVGLGPLGDTMTLYILMEPIQFTFASYVNHKHGIQMKWFAPFLKQLGHTLAVLKQKYNYTHRDLHSGNVMIDAAGNIKIIDFGYSSLEFRGLHYHDIDVDELDQIECTPGLDLAIFFTSVFNSFNDEIYA
jgi:serine/threonine protein kinase